MEPATRLVLIRHGESCSTVEGTLGGHAGCRGLTRRGRRQAQALADRLDRTGELSDTSVLLTSVLPRAIETAEIVAPALGGLEIERDCDFCELHVGEADGLTWEEFRSRYRPAGRHEGRFRPLAPGGESWATFSTRVGTALHGIASAHPGMTVVVVCHGGVIEGSLLALGNLPLRRSFDVAIGNTSLTEWTRPAGAAAGSDEVPARPDDEIRWTLVRFNDTAHLAGVDESA